MFLMPQHPSVHENAQVSPIFDYFHLVPHIMAPLGLLFLSGPFLPLPKKCPKSPFIIQHNSTFVFGIPKSKRVSPMMECQAKKESLSSFVNLILRCLSEIVSAYLLQRQGTYHDPLMALCPNLPATFQQLSLPESVGLCLKLLYSDSIPGIIFTRFRPPS